MAAPGGNRRRRDALAGMVACGKAARCPRLFTDAEHLGVCNGRSMLEGMPNGSDSPSCEHPEVDVWHGSAAEDEDYINAPYGRIVQRGACRECAARVERTLRASGWSAWG
jgi:hypothetical protein